jgi:hypothetical protein
MLTPKRSFRVVLRSGEVYTSKGIVEFVKQLKTDFKDHRIILRGDSGFFSGELLDVLEENHDGYLIKVKLRNLTSRLETQYWRSVRNQPGFQQCQFEYRCDGWNHFRRFVAIHEEKPKELSAQLSYIDVKDYEYFCYVQREGLSPWKTHITYAKRATSETKTIRRYLIRVSGKRIKSSRQLFLKTTNGLLFTLQWEVWMQFAP